MLVDNDDHVNVYYTLSSQNILLSLNYGVLCKHTKKLLKEPLKLEKMSYFFEHKTKNVQGY